MGREKGDTGKSLGTSVGGGLTTHGLAMQMLDTMIGKR